MLFHKTVTAASVLLVLLAMETATAAPPHDATNGIQCWDCHVLHSGSLYPSGPALEAICLSCHNPTGMAASMSDVASHPVNGGTTIVDCAACHDAHGPDTTTDPHIGGLTTDNLRLVRGSMSGFVPTAIDPTIFHARPAHFAFDDTNPPWVGACQACHTTTSNHTNDGSGDNTHSTGADCVVCHPHEQGFLPTGCVACHGQPPDGSVFPNQAGAHAAHWTAPYGPQVSDCLLCHATLSGTHENGLVSFASGADPDGNGNIDLAETDVCDGCHSPDGAFDGVAEAKAKWATATRVSCEGCHDLGTSTIAGVAAPAVAGDNVTWGYYATGHGTSGTVVCTDCHDPDVAHIDGNPRTYEIDSSGVVNAYTASYRLAIGMDIPRPSTATPEPEVWRYDLCFSCHDASEVLGDPLLDPANPFYRIAWATEFRHSPTGYGSWGHGGTGQVLAGAATEASMTFSWWMEDTGRGSPGTERAYLLPDITQPYIYRVADPSDWQPWFLGLPVVLAAGSTAVSDNPALLTGGQTAYAFGLPNAHYFHLSNIGDWWDWDSDWDGSFVEGGNESTRSCPTCHNVHGSTFPAMLRDGQLVGITGLQFGVDPAYPAEGSFVIPYESGTCEGLCHNSWDGMTFVPRPTYWYR